MRARENPVLKAGAFLLAVVTFAIAAVMGCYQMVNLNVIWGQTSAAGGYTIRYLENQDLQQISYLLDLIYTEQELGSLSSYEQQMKSDLEQQYQSNNTNLRWQLLDPEGGVLQGNTTQARPSQPEGIYWGEYYVSNLEMDVRNDVGTKWADVVDTIRNPPASPQRVESDTWAYELSAAVQQYREDPNSVDLTAVYLDGEGKGDMLRITTQFGVFAYAPSVQNVIRSNVFGYHYDLDAEGWTTNAEEGWTEGAVALDLVLWVNTSLAVEGDSYAKAYLGLDWWKNHNVAMLVLNLVCVAVGIAMLVFLCVGAGCRKGTEGVYVNWFHRLPGELILVALFLLASYPVSWLVEDAIMDITYTIMPMKLQLLLVGGGMAAMTAMTAGLLTTVSARLKSHTLVRSTLLWWAWGWIKKILGMARRTIPLVWRVGMGGCLYMLVSLVLLMSNAVFLWVVISVVLVVYLCSWAHCWKQIRRCTGELLKGNLNVQISCHHMPHDLREHAQQLNNLGQSISQAVAERMRSEHFKAELITNVSHDLKTPLTSIINYVDLLKKEPMANERVEEYINVLERKSNRLKKLTEDLVEASKASTGVLSVELARLDLGEIADQALGEYEERLQAAGLAVVRTLPDHPVWVMADGRRLWRVLDNLLGNCAKYALEGSRVYVELHYDDKSATLSMKNISREALNVPVERLMERFVRGDESRSTDGSGLGLSIAQSMTELQKGTFQIEIDGDLFKAMVTLPLAPSEELAEMKG